MSPVRRPLLWGARILTGMSVVALLVFGGWCIAHDAETDGAAVSESQVFESAAGACVAAAVVTVVLLVRRRPTPSLVATPRPLVARRVRHRARIPQRDASSLSLIQLSLSRT